MELRSARPEWRVLWMVLIPVAHVPKYGHPMQQETSAMALCLCASEEEGADVARLETEDLKESHRSVNSLIRRTVGGM
jgi:hypothetical protein